ncbi:MAG: cell division protein FtsQ/DivIB [Gammaproteobacteria bacterium]|nr:cell division protein FtsQ/DivIB [Gammaproteobacteria bacterium]
MTKDSATVHATRQGTGWGAGRSDQPLNPASGLRLKLFVLMLLAGALSVLIVLNFDRLNGTINQPVTRVMMESQWQQIDETEVQPMLGDFMGVGFFEFDMQGVKHRLQQHPWVRRASVKKVWPNGVAISLLEQVAIARWGENQLLNQYGEIFSPDSTVGLAGLPQLDGPESAQVRVMEQFHVISQLFLQSGLRVTALSLSERGNWELELNGRTRVTAGREEVLARLNRFLRLYDQLETETLSDIASVDLRYDNGIAIRPTAADMIAYGDKVGER